jgi:hypothetical protein
MAPQEGMPTSMRPDPLSPIRTHSRTYSMSSDRTSMTGFGSLLTPPVSVSPEAIFIATSAASQIVTNDHDSRSDTWFDQHGIEPSGETALVAPAALKLVNKFLDQLLFNFLSVAQSTSLAALRPAVSDVLKPKLAKDAISGADQELHEYLGGGEDEELLALHNGIESRGSWDLELVWKRTRLRCMVYSSLGDMEEEDEDMYTEQEQLDTTNSFRNSSDVVSPAVAIFLTSILEFMGEQALIIAGQAAYLRLRAKYEKDERDGFSQEVDIADRVVVEEADMERVALDRTLGRLWRGWKKRIRSSTSNSMSMSRSFSRESMRSRNASRRGSIGNDLELIPDEEAQRLSLAEIVAPEDPAITTPLPMTEDDIREIEIPGLVANREDEDDSDQEWELVSTPRPKSMFVFPSTTSDAPASKDSPTATPIFLSENLRKRSNTVPSAPHSIPSKRYRVSMGDSSSIDPETQVSTPEATITAQDGEETTSSTQEESAEAKSDKYEHSAGVLTGVVAGAAAVAGIVASAKGGAPQTSAVEGAETDEDLNEEAQIMTSSRVSISGRHSPEPSVTVSRRSSIRSHSVHSLRIVDVAPRSPGLSRTSSVDADSMAPGRRASSILLLPAETPISGVASPVQRVATGSPVIKNSSVMGSRPARNSAEASISEIDEKTGGAEEGSLTVAAVSLLDRSPLRDSTATITPVNIKSYAGSSSEEHNSAFATSSVNSRDLPVSYAMAPAYAPGPAVAEWKNAERDAGVAPPLTPLREMMEGAPDTSDEASSIAPSTSDDTYDPYNHSRETSAVAPLQSKSASRAAAERSIRGSPASQTKPRTKSHTSASSTSSQSHKIRPVRTSEDSMAGLGSDKGQSFEQLIQSDQTIQYTLTPQSMREIEVSKILVSA